MKEEKIKDLNPSIEDKIIKIIHQRHPEINYFNRLVLSKKQFNFYTSLIRITPHEFLALSKNFKRIRIVPHSTRWVVIERRDNS